MISEAVLSYAVALLPVLGFLVALRLMDSFKLVPHKRILLALCAGCAAAALCYAVNSAVFRSFPHRTAEFARFGAPVTEELAKGLYWMFLIATARVAFMVDAGICAFAVGSGFSVAENYFYLRTLAGEGSTAFLLRGLGTALMHGGVAAIAAMLSVFLAERMGWRGVKAFAPGLAVAIVIHSFFNLGLLTPVASTLAMLISMPVLIACVFLWSEWSLRKWLAEKLDRDIELLDMIATGELHQSRNGVYLRSLQDVFPPEICGDMLCMLQMTIELSVRAKGDLMLREAGLEVPPDPDLDAQFQELAYLEKSIGRTGMIAIMPLLSQTPRDLWEMRRLAQQATAAS